MVCTVEGCEAHYACRLRAKSLMVSPKATPTRHNRKAPAPHRFNQWEKGIAGEHRPGGGFMPYQDVHGDPIRMKRFHEKRHIFQAQLDSRAQHVTEGASDG